MNTTISPPPPGAPGHPWRSAWAVFAGILANFVLAGATDAVLHASGVYPPWLHPMADGLWALALGYRAVINVLGGYLTARLAPRRPMRHVAVLMGIGSLLGLMGVVATVGKGPEYGPAWYAWGIVVVGLPCTWLGGVLHEKRGAPARP